MSRRSPTGFVFSVAAEVIAVVFIVSVLPRVDLRTTAGAVPAAGDGFNHANEAPSLLPLIPSWPSAADSRNESRAHETSYYQRRIQPAAAQSASRDLPAREPTPLIAVDPARPDYVEQRLDRASQDLVNTVGSYVSQAANDLLQAPTPSPNAPQKMPPLTPAASSFSRLPPIVSPPASSFSTAPPPTLPGSFPTQPQAQTQPRPWVRY